jgi:hypothetical protein
MTGSARMTIMGLRGVLLWCVIALCSLRSTSAWADPVPDPDRSGGASSPKSTGNPPKIAAIWIDIPADVVRVCSERLADATKLALGCDPRGRAYWTSSEIQRKGAASAASLVFRPPAPAEADICDAVALLNDPDPSVEISEVRGRLLLACGYRKNPARNVQSACKEAKSPPDATMAAKVKIYREKLKCDTPPTNDSDRAFRRWNGDPATLPICADVLKYGEGIKGMPAVTELARLCGEGHTRGGLPSVAATIALPLLQGLGDFLSARAKEELTAFASEQLGRMLCTPTAGKIDGQTLFPGACAVMFPGGTGEAADGDAIPSGRFQRVLTGELFSMPARLLQEGFIEFGTDAEEQQIKVILTALVTRLMEAPARGDKVLDFFADLEAKIRRDLGAQRLTPTCVFEAKKKASVPCAMMLFLTVAAQAKQAFPIGRDPDADETFTAGNTWIKAAAAVFCERYGGGASGDARCLFGGFTAIDADFLRRLRDVAETTVHFYDDMGAIAAKLAASRADHRLSLDAAAEAAAGAASALRPLTMAIVSFSQEFLPALPPGAAPPERARLARLKQAVEVIDEVLQAVAAAMKKDVHEVAASLRLVLALPMVTARMSPAFKQGLRFMFDMVEARTRDDVRKVLEDNAAPLGSYKAKFEATTLRVTLNGFVGLFGGLEAPLFARSRHASYKAPNVAFLQPLSAPMGVDLSGPAFGGQHHLGATFTLIDPLALRITEGADKTTQADFDGVLTPGALFRWGMFRSPIVFMVGVRVQPLLKSVERTCGAAGAETPCWQGAVSGMAGLAVDLPLFPLN